MDMAKRITKDATMTFRLSDEDKAAGAKQCRPDESLGDFAREAWRREVARRQAEKSAKKSR